MPVITDEMVAAYHPEVHQLAVRLQRYGSGIAEYDDLYQEGLIAVWLSLSYGHTPTPAFIKWRMLNWIRYLRDPFEYDMEVPDVHAR